MHGSMNSTFGVAVSSVLAAAVSLGACRDAVELGGICGDEGLRCACLEAEQDLTHLPASCKSEPETCSSSEVSPAVDVCNACMADNRDRYFLDDTPLLRCACRNCAVQLAACRDSTDFERNQLCQSVVNCALRQNCAGSECYCGEGVSKEECKQNDDPQGPCAPLIAQLFEAEAGCEPGEPEGGCILRYQENGDDNALHRAFVLSACMGNPVYGRPGHCLPAIIGQADAGVVPRETR